MEDCTKEMEDYRKGRLYREGKIVLEGGNKGRLYICTMEEKM